MPPTAIHEEKLSGPIEVGLVWYRREDYPRVLQIMLDAEDLQESWNEWRRDARRVERELRRQGVPTSRVVLDPDTFLNWCAVRGLEPIASSRSAWASETARARTRNERRDRSER